MNLLKLGLAIFICLLLASLFFISTNSGNEDFPREKMNEEAFSIIVKESHDFNVFIIGNEVLLDASFKKNKAIFKLKTKYLSRDDYFNSIKNRITNTDWKIINLSEFNVKYSNPKIKEGINTVKINYFPHGNITLTLLEE